MKLYDISNNSRSPLIRNTLLALLLWTAGVAISLLWSNQTLQQQSLALAKMGALSNINKDMAFRTWAASHGGAYVPPDENTPPNPYLHVPNRDVVTTEGKRLTLMNPAYMLRQIMGEYSRLYGVKGHITSLQLTNPINQPDAWEKAALESFQQGANEAVTTANIDSKPYLRMIKPFLMEQGCLKCHADTGVKVGEVRGGISASVPLEPIYAASVAQERNIYLFHGIAWLSGMGLIGLVAWRSKRESTALARAEKAEDLASHDGLTGLYNHRMFYTLLEDEIARTRRYKRSVALLMLDIDHFKRVNDSYGHVAGDRILEGLARLLEKTARHEDLVCRYGGEEISIILPEANVQMAMQMAERLRVAVEQAIFNDDNGEAIRITVSLGTAALPELAATLPELMLAADTALYAAKEGGRNRVCQYEKPDGIPRQPI